MPSYRFDILALLCELENETYLAEALLIPDMCRLEAKPDKALANLRDSLVDFFDKLPNLQLHTVQVPKQVNACSVKVVLEPPKRSVRWSEPVELTFAVACWQQRGAFHGFVPSLTIEVIAESEPELLELLPGNIIQELQRRNAAGRLDRLLWHQRVVALKLASSEVEINVTGPRKRAESESGTESAPSVLKEVADNLNLLSLPPAHGMEEQTARLADLLVGPRGRSVLLVGSSGVGKTALAQELVRQRRLHHLGSTVFWQTSGARLMVGADCFGDWQERCKQVVAQASSERAILLLGNLFELAEVARHATTPQGMAGYFRPFIERGDLLCIVECTPQQRDLLERDHPHLLQAFSVLTLNMPGPEACRAMLAAAVTPGRIEADGIRAVESLHRRYARYSAYPGRPLQFLRDLLAEQASSQAQRLPRRLGASEVAAAFAAETGMPRFMVDDSLPLDLKAAEDFFSCRILSQEEGVRLVVDLMASVKAGLSPPERPIASLLLIGPTGVGKTEMARTLAEFLFQDRKRMVRFDMSEFADPLSVERLVGGQGSGQGLLTCKVREQPFGVVLFDELEKADPGFFDLLLQILGEGRLTDEGGRVADFTNSVIVMTSNLGAASFSKGPLGFRGGKSGESDQQARREFTSAVKAAFRPELFNRIDRLIPFSPLTPATAAAVARRETEKMLSRDGLSGKNLVLTVAPGVAEHLAELGYDRRYGARPLKRAIERTLLEPLAGIAAGAADRKTEVEVTFEHKSLRWKVVSSGAEPARKSAKDEELSIHRLARAAMDMRRLTQGILDGRQAHALRNQVHRLLKLKARKQRAYLAEELLAQLALLDPREKLVQRLDETSLLSRELESQAVLGLQGFQQRDGSLAAALSGLEGKLAALVLDLFASSFDNADFATVLVFPEKGQDMRPLLQAYLSLWQERQFEVAPYRLSLGPRETVEQKNDSIRRLAYGDELENRALWCEPVPFKDSFKDQPLGVAVELRGEHALPLMVGEAGLHLFGSSNPRSLEVTVIPSPLKDFEPPADLHFRKALGASARRRFYNTAQGLVEDPRLERRRPWNGKGLEKILCELVPAELARIAEEACR